MRTDIDTFCLLEGPLNTYICVIPVSSDYLQLKPVKLVDPLVKSFLYMLLTMKQATLRQVEHQDIFFFQQLKLITLRHLFVFRRPSYVVTYDCDAKRSFCC